jgi:sortase A
MDNVISKKKIIKALVVILELLAIGGFLYLIFLPFYPAISYYFKSKSSAAVNYKNIEEVKKEVEQIIEERLDEVNSEKAELGQIKSTTTEKNSELLDKVKNSAGSEKKIDGQKVNAAPKAGGGVNRLIIPKIGVNAPIIESADENYGLDRGVWRLPKSSTPEEEGNMIITGHRFKYLPPSNLTFYLFHKLEEGDIASVVWNGSIYYYRISEKKIVSAADTSILRETDEPTLTMYTCDPIYSTKNRLVITSRLINKN